MGLEPNSNSNNKKCQINKKCSTYLKIMDLLSIKVEVKFQKKIGLKKLFTNKRDKTII